MIIIISGAYYFYEIEPGLNYEDTMLGVFNYSVKENIPYRFVYYF